MKQSGSSASPATINAHQSELACIALNQIGSKIATASEKVIQHYLIGRNRVVSLNSMMTSECIPCSLI